MRSFGKLFASVLGVATLATSASQGAVRPKVNNQDNLNMTSSWTGGVPGLNDVASWTSAVTGANTVSLGADTVWRGISVIGPGGLVTINAGNTLTVGANGIDMSAATQDLTINAAYVMQAYSSQIWTVATGRTLTLGGTITRGAGAVLNAQLAGTGTIKAASLVNDTTGILGAWATIGTTTGIRYATNDGTGTLTAYTGTSSTTAAIGATPLVNYEVGAVGAFGTGASFNTLRYSGAAGTITGAFTANGLLNASAGALTFSGAVNIGANRELVVTATDTTRNVTLSGAIGDSLIGPSALVKAGSGSLTLSSATGNTYTGITYIPQGTVSISHASALGTTAGGTFIYSGDNTSGTTAPGGTLSINGGITVGEALSMSQGSGNSVSVLTSAGNNTLTGVIAVTGTGVRWNVSSGQLTITGGIIGNNSQVVFNAGGTGTYLITGAPMNLGTGSFYYDSGSTVVAVASAGNLWGVTTVAGAAAGGRLRTDAANVLPNTTRLNLGQAYAAGAIVDLNGFSQTVGELVSNTFLTTNVRTVTSATAATLTVNQTTGLNASTISDANLTGAISLVKNGINSLIYAGISTTTGSFTINRGIFAETFGYANASATGVTNLVNNISSASPLILGGGTFQVIGRNNGTATALAGATWVNDSNTITVTSTNGLAPGQLITGGTGLPAGVYVVAVLNGTQFLTSAKTTAAQASAAALAVTNQNSFTASQSFANTTLNAGGSAIAINPNIINVDATVLNLGTVTRNAGATLAFTLPTGTQSATNGITSNLTNINGGILGGWATVGNDWASNATNVEGGNIVALDTTGYTDVTRQNSGTKTIVTNTAANVRIIEGSGGTVASITPAAPGITDINTLASIASGGAVTYDPGTTDTLRLGAEGGILLGSAASALNIGASANDGILTAGGATDAAGNIYLTNNHASNLLTVNSTITDNGAGTVSVIKAGAGTVVLAGTNPYRGKTYIGGGKLSIASQASLGANPGNLVADQITIAGGTLLATATFSINDSGRGITLAPAGGIIETNTSITLTVANVITGSGELNKAGAGTLILSAANTFTGETVHTAGTLTLGNVNALQNSTLYNNSTVSFAAGTNTYNLGGLRGNTAINFGTNSLSVGSNNLATTYGGVLSGTGGFIKVGTAVLNLTAANTYSGDTLVSGGYLGIYHANGLQNSTLNTGMAGSQAIIFAPGIASYNVGGLKGADDLDIGSSNVSVGANNQSTVFTGALVSPLGGSLTKVGTGTLTLSGISTYNGATAVNAGTLQVGNAGTGSIGTGAVTVATNANLTGSGTLQGSSFSLASNATLRPGDAIADSSHATLTFTPVAAGVFNLQSGSKTILSLSSATNEGTLDGFAGTYGTAGFASYLDGISGTGNHDRLVFNGTTGSTLTLSGSITVVADSFTPKFGQVFNLLDWATTVSTMFDSAFSANTLRDGLADNGSLFDLPDLNSATTGLYWDTSRFVTSGVIAVVPEPSRALLLVAGFLGLALRRRRK